LYKTYWFVHDDACLLHGPVKLIKIDLALVLNIEKLEHFLQKLGLIDILRILLHDFGLQLILKTTLV
jgi:hypothetical protein